MAGMHPIKVMTEHTRLLFPLDEALRDWLDFMRSLDAEERKALEWAVQGCVPHGHRMLDRSDFEWLRDTLLEFIDAEAIAAHKHAVS